MAAVWIPALLRDLTGGKARVEVPGATVRQVIDNLETAYPGTRGRLCQGDDLEPAISVAVDGEIARLRMLQPVRESSEVHFLPAIGGGDALRLESQE